MKGFKVPAVQPESVFLRAGFRKGDILTKVGATDCVHIFAGGCGDALESFGRPGEVSYSIIRQGKPLTQKCRLTRSASARVESQSTAVPSQTDELLQPLRLALQLKKGPTDRKAGFEETAGLLKKLNPTGKISISPKWEIITLGPIKAHQLEKAMSLAFSIANSLHVGESPHGGFDLKVIGSEQRLAAKTYWQPLAQGLLDILDSLKTPAPRHHIVHLELGWHSLRLKVQLFSFSEAMTLFDHVKSHFEGRRPSVEVVMPRMEKDPEKDLITIEMTLDETDIAPEDRVPIDPQQLKSKTNYLTPIFHRALGHGCERTKRVPLKRKSHRFWKVQS